MNTESGSGKRKKDDEDRISKLTDDLLLKIMSFLDSKEAVQTCILSKRWESLWQFLPNLNIDLYNYSSEPETDEEHNGSNPSSSESETDDEDYRLWRSRRTKFVDARRRFFSNFIVQFLLRRHPSDLDEVRIQFSSGDSADRFLIDGLLSYAVKHNIKKLTFHCGFLGSYFFPKSFWNFQSLTALDLEDNPYMELDRLPVCPALKSLRLFDLNTFGPNLETFLSGCPNLETLELDEISVLCKLERNICINGLNLKRLQLAFAKIEDEIKFEIYAPQLTSFKLSTQDHCCYAPMVCLRDNVASLNDVYFDINSPNEEEHVLHLINTFNEFRHAKSLTLSTSTIKVLTKFPSLVDQNRVPFANLKHLKIKVGSYGEKSFEMHACVMNYFLNSSTMLKICNRFTGYG